MTFEEIAWTPFAVLEAVEKAYWRNVVRVNGGEEPWDPDAIPEPEDPDGPPPDWLFCGYGMSLGMSQAQVVAELARQKAAGGYGRLPKGLG